MEMAKSIKPLELVYGVLPPLIRVAGFKKNFSPFVILGVNSVLIKELDLGRADKEIPVLLVYLRI